MNEHFVYFCAYTSAKIENNKKYLKLDRTFCVKKQIIVHSARAYFINLTLKPLKFKNKWQSTKAKGTYCVNESYKNVLYLLVLKIQLDILCCNVCKRIKLLIG